MNQKIYSIRMVSKKVCKAVSPSAGLIFLDSRFHGNDNNGYFLTFCEFIRLDSIIYCRNFSA